MTDIGGHMPSDPPPAPSGRRGLSPFMRLARVHAMGAASDAAVAVTLAGSIFFSISPDDSRGRVALYLALTMAPFALVAPLLGPAIDRARGGRRLMIIMTAIARGTAALLMVGNLGTLWLFPLAFTILVMQKTYSVAKSAVVPTLVRSETDLVSANSRLALIGGISGGVGAAVAGAATLIGGPPAGAVVATVGFVTQTALSTRLAKIVVAAEPAEASERAELRSTQIVLAAYVTGILRAIVGFVTFLLAFEFRGGSEGVDVSSIGSAAGGASATVRGIEITGDPAAPAWHFGVVLAFAGIGALLGARFAPQIRRRTAEEKMLQAALVAIGGAALFCALTFDLFGAAVLSFVVGGGAATGKLAFDSLVQRAAPDANYGRSFARFEARFQGAWVVGAFIPAVVPLNLVAGGFTVAAATAFALASYLLGKPAHSAVSFPSSMTPPMPPMPKRRRRPGRAKRAEAGHDPSEDLSMDDLRPSQPGAPAGTSQYTPQGWGLSEPVISTGDGVEVDGGEEPPAAPFDYEADR